MGSFQALKQRHREERQQWPQETSVRVHRALSWLQRAELCRESEDGEFIFLWIAFNAAYANDVDGERPSETQALRQFLYLLHHCDGDERLDHIVWEQFSGPIRVLLNNPYIFQPFWDCQKQGHGDDVWRQAFDKAQAAANRALGKGETVKVLSIVLDRIYTLRNQLVHGGASWNSQVNRAQLRDCSALMRNLVPAVIAVMMDAADQDWGRLHYPVVG